MHKTHKSHPTHFFFISLVLLGAILSFVALFQYSRSSVSKASSDTVTLKIALEGDFSLRQEIRTEVILYRSLGKVKEYSSVPFIYQYDKTFEGTITLPSLFDFNALYAIYIKPRNYFGRLFCRSVVSGKVCTVPQFMIQRGGNVFFLNQVQFRGGDIPPINGRVDAEDLSKVMDHLGKMNDYATDVDGNGITNTLDYNLVRSAYKDNVSDDVYTLEVPWAPTPIYIPYHPPTRAPTYRYMQRPFPTPTFPFPDITYPPTPTLIPTKRPTPTPTRKPTRAPTRTPTPTPTLTWRGVCQVAPGSYAKNTCDIELYNINSIPEYSACNVVYAFNPGCKGVSLKQKCTCPTGKICFCQLKDKTDQVVTCTNKGQIEIRSCR
jgi:hypothetical protein